MNILIHGAVNGTNFGDCLYAQMYNDYIKSIHPTGRVCFWENALFGAGEHLKSLSSITTEKDINQMDALVYMPGGYFGEGPTVRRRIKQYVRYFRLGNRFIKKKKKILVSAVGGEQVNSKWLRGKICHILKNADLITTRNVRTAEFFQPYTPVEITPLFDVILHIRRMNLGDIPADIETALKACTEQGKKKIFFHMYAKDEPNRDLVEKILPAINRYVEETGAHLFLGTDYVSSRPLEETELYQRLKGEKTVCRYRSPLELCAVLDQCDFIITPKLHVGVISSALGKSVVSVALVPVKTKAFYEDIGCAERSISLDEATPEKVYDQIVKFADTPIQIPQELVEKAEKNLDLLKEAIDRLDSKKVEMN